MYIAQCAQVSYIKVMISDGEQQQNAVTIAIPIFFPEENKG